MYDQLAQENIALDITVQNLDVTQLRARNSTLLFVGTPNHPLEDFVTDNFRPETAFDAVVLDIVERDFRACTPSLNIAILCRKCVYADGYQKSYGQ